VAIANEYYLVADVHAALLLAVAADGLALAALRPAAVARHSRQGTIIGTTKHIFMAIFAAANITIDSQAEPFRLPTCAVFPDFGVRHLRYDIDFHQTLATDHDVGEITTERCLVGSISIQTEI
jgi:hypothetical protein